MKFIRSVFKMFWENWERIFFSLFGLFLAAFSAVLILAKQIPEGSAVFGLSFLSFIYANVSRFRKFKGLGFEAELWEDKKREAEGLIERLRVVVSIYSREAVLNKIRAGRWREGIDWAENWKLYDELVQQHTLLGQQIDFSQVKKEADDLFLFDLTYAQLHKIQKALAKGTSEADKKIYAEFGPVIRDIEGHNRRLAQCRAIKRSIENPAALARTGDLADAALKMWEDSKARLKTDFDVDVEVDQDVLDRLTALSSLFQRRPLVVTDELIAWSAEKRDDY